jgi:hypothetical protein
MLGLCLVAVCAVVAYAASSASAATPEWGQCFEKAGGKYSDANCQVKSKVVKKVSNGTHEWRKGPEVKAKHFEGGGTTGVLEGEYIECSSEQVRAPKCNEGETEQVFLGKPLKVECESETNTGEASGKNGISHVAVTFKGCKLLGSIPCSNTEVSGEIHTNALKGSLGYINKAKKEVGVLLEPNEKHGRFAQFGCLEGKITTVVGEGNAKEGCAYPLPKCGEDGILSPITPVNEMTNELTQVYTINEHQENVPSHLEGKGVELLESYNFNAERPEFTTKWSKAGETITNVNKPEETAEIKA